MTTATIDEQRTATEAAIRTLEGQRPALARDAVNGNAKAAGALATVETEIATRQALLGRLTLAEQETARLANADQTAAAAAERQRLEDAYEGQQEAQRRLYAALSAKVAELTPLVTETLTLAAELEQSASTLGHRAGASARYVAALQMTDFLLGELSAAGLYPMVNAPRRALPI
jgi:hypothetical protein